MKLLYAEGFLGFGSSYAIPHAWLSLNGKVVDTTVRPQESGDQRVMGTIPRGWEYYGVELETERCIQVLYILQVRPSGPDLRAGPGTEHQHHLPPVRARRQEKQKVTSQLQMQSLRVPSGSRPERGRIHPAQGPSPCRGRRPARARRRRPSGVTTRRFKSGPDGRPGKARSSPGPCAHEVRLTRVLQSSTALATP